MKFFDNSETYTLNKSTYVNGFNNVNMTFLNPPMILLITVEIINAAPPNAAKLINGLSTIKSSIFWNFLRFSGLDNHLKDALIPTPAKNNFPKSSNLSKIFLKGQS